MFGALSEGGQLLTWAIRHLMVATLRGESVPISVLRVFESLGGASLARALNAVLLLAARDADRPLVIHPPCCPELSSDEQRLVAAISFDDGRATRVGWGALLDGVPSAALLREAAVVAQCLRRAGVALGGARSTRL